MIRSRLLNRPSPNTSPSTILFGFISGWAILLRFRSKKSSTLEAKTNTVLWMRLNQTVQNTVSVSILPKKRPFGLKTRARKRILYCSKSEQCHCEQEKKQKLRKKTKRLRGSQPDRDAAQAFSRPQLRTRLNPKHSACAVGNTKYRFDQTYSIPDEMRSTS